MKFDLYKPCSDCPFLRKGGIRLTLPRVREIAGAMLDSQGSTFVCHKTTGSNDEGDSVITKNSRHCAGALIFMEKNGNCTQPMRIMERLQMYNAKKLMANKATAKLVFDSLAEMLEANRTAYGTGRSRKRTKVKA